MSNFQYSYKHLNSKQLKSNWDLLKKEISILSEVEITSVGELETYIAKINEFDILINEIDRKFYIQSMQNTKDIEIQKLKTRFESSILNSFTKERSIVNSKIIKNEYIFELTRKDQDYQILFDSLKDKKNPINEDYESLDNQIASLVTEYNNHLAEMTLIVDGETLPTIMVLLTKMKDSSVTKRKELLKKIKDKENQFIAIFDENFDKQINLRTLKAQAFGFSNYRDFKWHEFNRTDYTPKDIEHFCNSIRDIFIPIQTKFTEIRKERLGLKKIKYLDLFENIFSKEKLNFFSNIEELKEKVNKVYYQIYPEFQKYFNILEKNKQLDFEIREHKSSAMFSSNLPETGLPFVYLLAMNNAQGISSVFHETTHAIHSLYNSDKDKQWIKKPAIEANELFPLTMELISMEYWDEFVDSEKDLLIARLNKFEDCLKTFRMVGLWDKFQTWVYTNPKHTHKERNSYWLFLLNEFDLGIEPEKGSETSWQNRPLIFRFPFYMIEYGIATLGALSIYKNYRIDKQKTIQQLVSAMKLGNTKPLKYIYKTAGVDFDFTKEKVKETGDFLKEEIEYIYSRIQQLN